MNFYLQNLLPRMQQYSLSLDRKEVFMEYPWVRLDEQGNKETYIFKRNGELIMSLNGSVVVGKWELLITANALLIDRVKDKILLKHDFIDRALMVLKTDNLQSTSFILMNANLIPDLDAVEYLKTLYAQKNNINRLKLDNGQFLELEADTNRPGYLIGSKAYIEGKLLKNVRVTTLSGKIIEIENGIVHEVYKKRILKSGAITFQADLPTSSGTLLGAKVYLDGYGAPDGKYTLEDTTTIIVKDGIIANYAFDWNILYIAIVVIAIIIIFILSQLQW